MEIMQAQQLKLKLEKDIKILCIQYEECTGTHIDSLSLERTKLHTMTAMRDELKDVSVTVRI